MIGGEEAVNEYDFLQEENCFTAICKQPSFSTIIVSRISCGEHHVLLLGSGLKTPKCSLYTFGIGTFGELGGGVSLVSASNPQLINIPEDLLPVNISAATYHSVVVGLRGEVYTFGCGAYFRLGHGDDKNRYTPTLVESLPTVYDLAKSTSTEFDGDGSREEVKICVCSLWHTIVVFENNDVYAWGWNKFNQIGGADEMVIHPRRINELDCPYLIGDDVGGDDIVKVDCNIRYTAFLTKAGRVLFMGKLGLSSIEGLISDCSDGMSSFQEHISVVSTSARGTSAAPASYTVVAASASELNGCVCCVCKVNRTESSVLQLQAQEVSNEIPVRGRVNFNGMICKRWTLLLSCG